MLKKDRYILESIRSGNPDKGFAVLYKRVLPKIRSYVMKNNGSMEEANDIFQDTIIVFYQKVKENKFDDSNDIAGYMFAIARNAWRRKAVRNQKVQATEQLPDVEMQKSVMVDLLHDERMTAVNKLFDQLGNPCNALLRLSIFEELKPTEIMERLQLSSADVAKTYTYRCRKKLTAMVQKNPIFLQLFDR